MTTRRFPPPWSVEDIGAAFVVKDSTGQQLAYIYFEDEPGRRSAAKLLTREAKRIGRYFAEPSQSDFRTTHGGAPCPAMDSH
jgi:hypothetical protein